MAFNVRVFGYRGLEQLHETLPRQFSSDSVHVLVQPYEWAGLLVAGGAAVSSVAQPAPDKTQILRIEVPDGQSIRYEINPPGRNVAAGNQSPILSGHDQYYFRQGWVLSIIDASGLP